MAITISHTSKIISGNIDLTASKSISNRVLIIKALCESNFEIKNLASAKDTETLIELLFRNKEQKFDVGHAGTVMRFLTAYLALKDGESVITGSERMQQRPIKVLVDALQKLGAKIEYIRDEGYPPIKISGGLIAGNMVEIDGGVSSQYISALMLIAPYLKNGLTINFKNEIISIPYINMTLEIMKNFGAEIKWVTNGIVIKEGAYEAKDFTVEADWSSASYWYGIAALAREVDVKLFGLEQDSLQGDAEVQEIYKNFGVETEFVENGIRLTKSSNEIAKSFDFDFENCPDIAQTVAVTCASLGVESKFTGLKTLRIKETDRIFALKTELGKLGYNLSVEEDDLLIHTSLNTISHQAIETYDDHRMAMSFAPLALKEPIVINDEDVVVKSYPNFWVDLENVSFEIS